MQTPAGSVVAVLSLATLLLWPRPSAAMGIEQFDGAGRAVVVAALREHQLADISRAMHEREHRCGGYFAFATRAEAEAFVRADRSRQAMQAAAAAAYTIDNQATVAPWLPQASEAEIYATIDHLSRAYPNRYFASTTGKTSATWIRDRWLALANGRADVNMLINSGSASASRRRMPIAARS